MEGQEASQQLLGDLVKFSVDEDLLLAAEEIAKGNEQFEVAVNKLRKEIAESEAEYERRTQAASERSRQRAEWRKATAKSASTNSTAVEKPPSPKRASTTTPARLTPAIPLNRGP